MSNKGEHELVVDADTREIFDGWSVRKTWRKEDNAWLRMVNKNSSDSYPFPQLHQSFYLEDSMKTLLKPAICQDIFWSSDGTSFVTVHDDYGIRQYLVPERRASHETVKELVPFTRTFTNQSVVASQVHRKYSLFNEANDFNIILLASRDKPLQIYPLSGEDSSEALQSLRSFHVSNPANESFQVPYVVDFKDDEQFFAGFDRNRVSLYDLNRRDPIWTVQSTRRACGNCVRKAIVSCFDQQANQLYAEGPSRIYGTYKNDLHLIDTRTSNEQLIYRSSTGKGLTQILRSANGHFIYTLKRNSSIIDVIDLRHSSRKISDLELPFKLGSQKFKASISTASGISIGTDYGTVVNWSSDLVEFGGISRYKTTMPCSEEAERHSFDREFRLPYDDARINIIQESPYDGGDFIVSYSPDKFAEGLMEHARSGVSIVHPIS